jgi:hypothetical protein
MTARQAHGTCARPARSNQPNDDRASGSHDRPTGHYDRPRPTRSVATRRRLDTSRQKKPPVVDNRLLASPGVVSVAIRWEASPPNCTRRRQPDVLDWRLERCRRGQRRRTCVHRLWMTVWTSVITGQTGR